jgi:RNA polymerase sigma factor (sigma-70 family)
MVTECTQSLVKAIVFRVTRGMAPDVTEATGTEPTEGGLSAQLAADLRAHRDGDHGAMARLVRRATPLLWHVARGYRLDTSTAEDVVQNALLALVRHGDSITEPHAVLRWLIVTARREAIRAAQAKERTELVEDPAATLVAPESESPELSVLANATQRVLWRNVSQLPLRCQRLLRAIAFAERPDYAALSDALGMPIGSIGPTRGRCLAKLRSMLSNDPEWGLS